MGICDENVSSQELWGKPATEIDINKRLLIRWCKFYANVLKMSDEDLPDRTIIANDYLLDRHLEELEFKRKNKKYGQHITT